MTLNNLHQHLLPLLQQPRGSAVPAHRPAGREGVGADTAKALSTAAEKQGCAPGPASSSLGHLESPVPAHALVTNLLKINILLQPSYRNFIPC